MKRMKVRFTALALLACFSLGLTACGGSDAHNSRWTAFGGVETDRRAETADELIGMLRRREHRVFSYHKNGG